MRIHKLLPLLAAVGWLMVGCGEEDVTPTEPAPTVTGGGPVGVSLGNQAALHPVLQWARAGLASDSVTYNVYFGTSTDPAIVVSQLTDTMYAPDVLQPGARYYWAVAAVINGAIPAKSAIYTFLTRTGITYPVATGDRWEYRYESTIIGEGIDIEEARYYRVTVRGSDGNWSFQPVYVLEEAWFNIDLATVGFDTCYYYAADSGLFLAGYTAASGIQPSGADTGDRPGGVVERLAAVMSPEALIVENPPKPSFKYPLEVNKEWTFRSGTPRIVKKVTGYEIIDVPAGRFGCFVVESRYDSNGDGTFDDNVSYMDYVSEVGLVKRTSVVYDADIVIGGHVIGQADITETYELVSVTL